LPHWDPPSSLIGGEDLLARSGVRIPTLAISARIPERTVATDEYRATSLISTLRERWNLGSPFTARDAHRPQHPPGVRT
jgi:phospholipase C